MDLQNYTKIECVEAGVTVSDKTECLRQATKLAKNSSILKNVTEAEIFEALQAREKIGSTGFENGVAIPHCRLKNTTEFVMGIISIPDGVDFDSLDGEKSNLIIFIIAPQSKTNKHVRLLSAISNILRIPDARKAMLVAKTPQTLLENFLRFNRDELNPDKMGEQSLFHITITSESIFQDILPVITAMAPSSLSIVEARQESEYLSKMPIFAGFWNDRESLTSKIIIAQIDKCLANETIRRLEDITGELDKCSEVSVCVQDVFYSSGRLQS
jgi:PTS system nitrogen regulatory IIA component